MLLHYLIHLKRSVIAVPSFHVSNDVLAVFRGHEVIKASSPLFCHIILFGRWHLCVFDELADSVHCGSLVAYFGCGLSVLSETLSCVLLPGSISVAFALIFGSLFAKVPCSFIAPSAS